MTAPSPARADRPFDAGHAPALGDPGDWLCPAWPAPPGVRCVVTTRTVPGHSAAPFEAFNLGLNTADSAQAVAANRAVLEVALGLPVLPLFLRQVHGVAVHRVEPGTLIGTTPIEADAVVTAALGRAVAILTADCLPVLFASDDGNVVGAAHAGWRGLAAGVLERAVAALGHPPSRLLAWLGPCIGQPSYEVGDEVRGAFIEVDAAAAAAFVASRPGHWQCDLAALARLRLTRLGLSSIHGGGYDTLADRRFYSHRRDGAASGRFASVIWRE